MPWGAGATPVVLPPHVVRSPCVGHASGSPGATTSPATSPPRSRPAGLGPREMRAHVAGRAASDLAMCAQPRVLTRHIHGSRKLLRAVHRRVGHDNYRARLCRSAHRQRDDLPTSTRACHQRLAAGFPSWRAPCSARPVPSVIPTRERHDRCTAWCVLRDVRSTPRRRAAGASPDALATPTARLWWRVEHRSAAIRRTQTAWLER